MLNKVVLESNQNLEDSFAITVSVEKIQLDHKESNF